MAILVLLNNFLHDFSAAGWLFGSVVLWTISRKLPDEPAGKWHADVLNTLLLIMRLSLVGIVVFGVVRALAYKTYEWNAAAGDAQITLLIVKHVILTGIFIPGLICYIRASRFLKKTVNE